MCTCYENLQPLSPMYCSWVSIKNQQLLNISTVSCKSSNCVDVKVIGHHAKQKEHTSDLIPTKHKNNLRLMSNNQRWLPKMNHKVQYIFLNK